ncbi:hypothetical protein [Emticicia sp.]|uniref:hypothetical protein n=1 Tax=Emticicia sp. TaxID=1930953 RepID=UPI0037500EAC
MSSVLGNVMAFVEISENILIQMMKKRSYLFLVLIVLFANNVCGQTLFIKELAEAKKLLPSAKKDSIIVDFIFRLTQIHSVNVEKWQDSLKLYATLNKN